MAALTQIPKTNISVVDIRDTLAAHGGNVSNDTLTFFTTAAKINPWSKHKPVPYNKDFCQDFDANAPNYDPGWWKNFSGSYGSCGLSWSVFSWGGPTSNTIPNVKDSNWTYTPPSSSNPKRLGDFSGYLASCNPPIATRITADKIKVDKRLGTWTFIPDIPPKNDSYGGLTIYDFTGLENYYLCAAVYQNGWNTFLGDKVTKEGCKLEVSLADLQTTTHEVVLCLATGETGSFMPLPSDGDNKTSFILDVIYSIPYYMEFTHIGPTPREMYAISNYQSWETPYSATDAIYFKARVIKNNNDVSRIYDSDLFGQSTNWEFGTTEKSLDNKLYNSSGQLVDNIDISSLAVGSSIDIIFYWDGFGSFNSLENGETLYVDFSISNSDGAILGQTDFVMRK